MNSRTHISLAAAALIGWAGSVHAQATPGQARLNALQHAADIWSINLRSSSRPQFQCV